MTQLTDLQFVGNRHTLEDIENILCTVKPLKDLRKVTEPYGGIWGRLEFLEDKIENLQLQLNSQKSQMYEAACIAIREHEEKNSYCSTNISTDQNFMIPIIRHEAQMIAEQVVDYRLQNLHIKFNY